MRPVVPLGLVLLAAGCPGFMNLAPPALPAVDPGNPHIQVECATAEPCGPVPRVSDRAVVHELPDFPWRAQVRCDWLDPGGKLALSAGPTRVTWPARCRLPIAGWIPARRPGPWTLRVHLRTGLEPEAPGAEPMAEIEFEIRP